jgi:GDSL-like lipase/acylhydrolase family protein
VSKRLLPPLVLCLSLLVAFFVAEMGLRFASSHWLHVFDVEMWRYARLVKLESKTPGVIEEHRPNVNALLMGVPVRTDEHGFRLPDPATETKRRPGDRVVAAVGDSVTFGWGAGEGETFPALLENLLRQRCSRPAVVHNAGIGNCNTSMELARYEKQVRQLHPAWVILGYSYNDAEPDAVPSHNPFLWHSALLALTSARLERHSGILSNYDLYYHGLYVDGRPGWERTKQALAEFGALLRRDGIPGTLLLMPELHRPKDFGSFAEIFHRVGEIGRAAGFEVIDPSGAFPPGPGESFWVSPEDAHPNVKGQTIYARALAQSKYACAP